MALAADTKLLRYGAPAHGGFGYQVAAGEQVYRGSLVALNAAGTLQRVQTAGSVAIVGFCTQNYNNTAGAVASPDWVQVERGWWAVTIAGATPANLDLPVYAIDDNTFTMNVPGSASVATAVAGNPNYAVAGSPGNGFGRAGANTGNGTISTIAAIETALTGTYLALFSAPTVFSVINPVGQKLVTAGATGTAYQDGGLTFTITAGGTAFVAGDSFTITVADNAVPLLAGSLSGFDKTLAVLRVKGS